MHLYDPEVECEYQPLHVSTLVACISMCVSAFACCVCILEHAHVHLSILAVVHVFISMCVVCVCVELRG